MKRYLFFSIFVLAVTAVMAQSNDQVIMKINGKDVKKSEFEYIYSKNNNEDAIDKKTLTEYVELFKNYKLKVAEAETQGLDTMSSFREELREYRTQLAKPYLNLNDFGLNENLIQREYDRLKEYVEISHILIPFFENGDLQQSKYIPADTLAAYKKALQVKKRLQKGENFEKLVTEVSADEYSKKEKRPGYLGWITALGVLPEMENAIYNTPTGEITYPVRTNFGYLLIKVHARKPNPGQIWAAHILVNCPEGADTVMTTDAIKKVDEIYVEAVRGDDFGELAKKYSDDKGSAENGGDLSWFGYNAMIKEFQDAAFALKEVGEISKPVRTKYGFHIIKLLGKKPLEPLSELREEIISRLEKNGDYLSLHEPGMEKLKKDNGFSMNENAYKKLKEKANMVYPSDTSFLKPFENDEDVLLITGDEGFTVARFIGFLKKNISTLYSLSTEALDERLKTFQLVALMEAEDKQLEKKYSDFNNLMSEYRDGILLFNVSNKEVWNRAMEDTVGLEKFFEANKDNYNWEKPHYTGYLILCKDAKTKKKMQKEVAKMSPKEAVEYLLENYRVGEVSHVKVERGSFVQGDNPFIDEIVFKTGKAERPENFQDFFVIGTLSRTPVSYMDVKGLVVTDYQDHLEKEWIDSLNKKYPVIIYEGWESTIK